MEYRPEVGHLLLFPFFILFESNAIEFSMYRYKITFFTFALLVLTPLGCGQKLPPGMPTLYKTTLVVTQDGAPLADASVVVVNEDFTSSPWSSGGVTDAAGQVVLKTEGQYTGVPAGKYIVTVTKIVGPPGLELPKNVNTDEEIRERDKIQKQIENNSFHIVDEKFMTAKSTPLKIEVPKKSSEITIDVSPAVKVKVAPDVTR